MVQRVRLIATMTKTVASAKIKTRNRMHMVRVLTGQTPYGTDATHKDISLGRSDIHKLWAVYDSESTTTDPKLPEWTLTSVQGTFTRGELITGSTSGAIARIVHTFHLLLLFQ